MYVESHEKIDCYLPGNLQYVLVNGKASSRWSPHQGSTVAEGWLNVDGLWLACEALNVTFYYPARRVVKNFVSLTYSVAVSTDWNL